MLLAGIAAGNRMFDQSLDGCMSRWFRDGNICNPRPTAAFLGTRPGEHPHINRGCDIVYTYLELSAYCSECDMCGRLLMLSVVMLRKSHVTSTCCAVHHS